jgi:integrase/recombinase XerD
MVRAPRTQISGPLAHFATSVYRDMRLEGYAVLSAKHTLAMMAHLSRWMEDRRISVAELRPERIDEFFHHRRAQGYSNYKSSASARPILRSLQRSAVALPGPEDRAGPHDELLDEFARYLASERHLTASTVAGYSKLARRFLSERFGDDPPTPRDLRTTDVTGFIRRASRRVGVGTSKLQVTTLRALLRWLYLRGEIDVDLAGCVPAIAGWRQTSLPRGLNDDQVERLLRSCDRRKSVGRRDYAAMLLMVRMGLRAGEVVALELDDIRWKKGEILVRGKGGKQAQLPLPHEVGEAIAAYLQRGRPRYPSRKLFLRSHAPRVGLGSPAVTALVRSAFQRAGVESPRRGAHALRHTAATQMLRRGGSLSEIAQVLRHSHIDTTAIYAKVDRDALSELAQPWPRGES